MYVITIEMTYRVFDNVKKLDLYDTPAPKITKPYLLGVLHDATERKYTYRVSQKSLEFVEMIKEGLILMGYKAWVYREGKSRNVYVVEFAKRILWDVTLDDDKAKIDYARGYFDTDGSVPRKPGARYYVYFAQKSRDDLEELKGYLTDLGISCGNIHIPSIRSDPDYYRFFVLSKSHNDFTKIVGSYHPEKSKYLRMKR